MKVNLTEKLASFDDMWSPKIVGELNEQFVKVVKLKGEYVWHSHAHEDELFMVLKGSMKLLFRNKTIELHENELAIVPHGVEHKPIADEICHCLLFEPKTVRNTGEVDHEYTIEPEDLERI